MGVKSFSPHSRQEDERIINRIQKDFSAGVFNDIPASTIPENGVAYLKNFINKGTELVGRSGSRVWGNYSTNTESVGLPTVATGITSTSTVDGTNRTITTSGYVFTSINIGDFFIHDNGTNEPILDVLSENQIVTETKSTDLLSSTNASLRNKINCLYFHTFLKKIVLHIGREIYISSDIYLSGWTQAFCESYNKPSNTKTTIDEKDNYVLIFDINGVYRLDLDITTNDSYYYYKINSAIPDSKIDEPDELINVPYIRRYLYGLSKMSGSENNLTRQTPGNVLLIDSGTNAIDSDGIDYSVVRMERSPEVESPNLVTGLTVPTIDGIHKDGHWDSYSLWGTTDLGEFGTDPVTGYANNPEQFIWIDDIPIMKAVRLNAYASTFTVVDGEITKADIGSDIFFYTGSGFSNNEILTVNETDGTFTTTGSYGSLSDIIGFIGAEKGAKFTWNSTYNTLTKVNGFSITEDDIGKRIFLSSGKKVFIKDVINNVAYLAGNQTLETTVYGCWNPDERKYSDSVSDEILRRRISGYPCQQRFFKPLPESNIGVITSGFIVTAIRNENYIYYSQLPDKFDYLAGYYHELYQVSLIKDGIRLLKPLNDKVVIYGYNTTSVMHMSSYSEIQLTELGISIATLPSQTVIDDNIGVISYGSVQSLENGYHIMITNEPAIRIFDGSKYSSNYASNKITEILRSLQPNVVSIYNPYTGYIFWGLDN